MGYRLPASLPRVRIEQMECLSLFGSTLRKQSVARAEAGRVSTVEAYARAAIEMGEAAEDVQPLLEYLRTLIDATAPFSSHGRAASCRDGRACEAVATAPGAVDGEAPAAEAASEQPKTTSEHTHFRQRALGLTRKLGLGAWTDVACDALARVPAAARPLRRDVNACRPDGRAAASH